MLEHLDLTQKIKKDDYKRTLSVLELRLAELQRIFKQQDIPAVVVFEGWKAAGKGTCINRLMRSMDPRGFKVYSLNIRSREEKLRPYLWWFAIRMPRKGYFAIFDNSWYSRVLQDRMDGIDSDHILSEGYGEIDAFEQQLVMDGYVIVKLFCHISRDEQKRRFKKMENRPTESWKITPDSWRQQRKYPEYARAAEEMIQKTSIPEAPWTLIESENRFFMRIKVFKTIIQAMEFALESRQNRVSRQIIPDDSTGKVSHPQHHNDTCRFWSSFDLTRDMDYRDYTSRLRNLQKIVRTIHHRMYMERVGACVVFQGWDASGKGGVIRRLLAPLDPRGFEVVTISAPTEIEQAHHYLWRFWTRIPKAGHLTIFDRSWYGRVLVERVEGFCPPEAWQRAYREINDFEKTLTNFRLVLVKFWLHIDKDEQLRRFNDRMTIPHKQWKITDEDWRNREKWDRYETAAADMIRQTSTPYAPWTVVESNNKLYARIKVLKTFISAMEIILNDSRPRPPLV